MKWVNDSLQADDGQEIGTLYQAGWGNCHLLLAGGKRVLMTNQKDKFLAMNALVNCPELRQRNGDS